MDFVALEPADFEEFCVSLLWELGFVNVDWRRGSPKGSGASDSGRDIEADLEREDIDGDKHLERWFIDAKHYAKAVPPTALEATLAWATAERPHAVLFVISGFLSNPAKEFLRDYESNNRPPFRIKTWEQPQLERLAGSNADLLARFLLTDMRPESEVLEAESKFFDLVWHERHQMIRTRDIEAEKEWEPGLLETAEKAAAEVRERYGGEVGPYDDFEWGMVSGKLSALRWVLGEEWDFLDT